MLASSSTLSHHSLESFLIDQTESDHAHQLFELSQHPQLGTMGQKFTHIWNIFCQETYKSAKDKKLISLLNEKQVRSLRKISVLVFVQGKNCVRLSELCQELDLDKLQLFKLIMEMSSKDLINARIDQKNNKCHIYASKLRRQKTVNREAALAECEARLQKIFQKNNELIVSISKNQ